MFSRGNTSKKNGKPVCQKSTTVEAQKNYICPSGYEEINGLCYEKKPVRYLLVDDVELIYYLSNDRNVVILEDIVNMGVYLDFLYIDDELKYFKSIDGEFKYTGDKAKHYGSCTIGENRLFVYSDISVTNPEVISVEKVENCNKIKINSIGTVDITVKVFSPVTLTRTFTIKVDSIKNYKYGDPKIEWYEVHYFGGDENVLYENYIVENGTETLAQRDYLAVSDSLTQGGGPDTYRTEVIQKIESGQTLRQKACLKYKGEYVCSQLSDELINTDVISQN